MDFGPARGNNAHHDRWHRHGVRAENVRAMAEVQGRIMVAGPRRGPDDIDPVVWRRALTMLRKVFQREWSE